jgi:hypothetical protein
MNRTISAIFRAGRIQLFHSAKMDSIKPLSATFGNGRMGFFYSASSSSIRPKSTKMADKSATWQPCRYPSPPPSPWQRCQMPVTGKRQIQHGKMPKNTKGLF